MQKLSSALILVSTVLVLMADAKLEFTPSVQLLRTIDYGIAFKGCTYAIDRLFVLNCPSQSGLYITDARSMLDQSNCNSDCSRFAEFDPTLTYLSNDSDLSHDAITQLKAQEYSYSALLPYKNELHLRYLDMLVVE